MLVDQFKPETQFEATLETAFKKHQGGTHCAVIVVANQHQPDKVLIASIPIDVDPFHVIDEINALDPESIKTVIALDTKPGAKPFHAQFPFPKGSFQSPCELFDKPVITLATSVHDMSARCTHRPPQGFERKMN